MHFLSFVFFLDFVCLCLLIIVNKEVDNLNLLIFYSLQAYEKFIAFHFRLVSHIHFDDSEAGFFHKIGFKYSSQLSMLYLIYDFVHS